MNIEELVKHLEQVEKTLYMISTKGEDSFFMVASINSIRYVRNELSKHEE